MQVQVQVQVEKIMGTVVSMADTLEGSFGSNVADLLIDLGDRVVAVYLPWEIPSHRPKDGMSFTAWGHWDQYCLDDDGTPVVFSASSFELAGRTSARVRVALESIEGLRI